MFENPPVGLAHRGGAAHPPNRGLENSLAAFRRAVDMGFTYLETDVRVTKDGVLLAVHDARLDRVTDREGAIAELTWRQVREARIGGTEPIPTMAELLEALPQARFNVDLKARGTPAALWAVLVQGGWSARVCVGSFSNLRLWHFRLLSRGRVATSAGMLGTAALRLLPFSVSRLFHSPGVAYQVPVRQRVGPLGIDVVTPDFVRRAHGLGKQVHVWTIDDRDEMVRLLDLGVDGIVSDAIDTLTEVLAARSSR